MVAMVTIQSLLKVRKLIMASNKKKDVKFEGSARSINSYGVTEIQIESDLQEKCKKNNRASRRKYNDFFLKCLEEIEELQPSGFACIQANRNFTVGVLPKYCTIPDPLTRSERERVERLLAE